MDLLLVRVRRNGTGVRKFEAFLAQLIMIAI